MEGAMPSSELIEETTLRLCETSSAYPELALAYAQYLTYLFGYE
jgi:hypothetical protein